MEHARPRQQLLHLVQRVNTPRHGPITSLLPHGALLCLSILPRVPAVVADSSHLVVRLLGLQCGMETRQCLCEGVGPAAGSARGTAVS